MTDTRRNPLKNLEQTSHDISSYLKTVTSEEYLSVYTIAKDDYQAQNAWFWNRLVYAFYRTRVVALDETLATIKNLKQIEADGKQIELEKSESQQNINAAPGILSRVWSYFSGTTESQPIKPEIEQAQVQSEVEKLSYDEDFLNKSVLQLDAIQDTSRLLNTAKTKQLSFIQITANLLKDGGWEETSFNTNLTRGLVKMLPGYDANIHLHIDTINLMKDSVLIELTNALQEEVDDKEKKYEQSVLEQSKLQEVTGIHQLKMSLIPNGEVLQTTETDQSNEEIEFQKLKLKLDLLEQEKMERDERIKLLEEDLDAAKKTLNSLRSEIEAKKQNAVVVNIARENSEALRKRELDERNDEVKNLTKGFKFGNVKDELEKAFRNKKIENTKKNRIEEAINICGVNESKNDIKSRLNDIFRVKAQDLNQKPLRKETVIRNSGDAPKSSLEKLARAHKPSIENGIQQKPVSEQSHYENSVRLKSTTASFQELRQKMEKNIKLNAIPIHFMNSRKEKDSEEDKLLTVEREIAAQTQPEIEPEQSWLLQSTIFKPGQLSQLRLKNENDEIECVSTMNMNKLGV